MSSYLFPIIKNNRVFIRNIYRAFLTIMELLGDTIIVLASQIVFFLVGWIFFVKMLFRDYELHHSLGIIYSNVVINLTGKCFSSVDILCELHPILHNVWTHYFRNCELPRQEFKVQTEDSFVILNISCLIWRYFHWYFAIYCMLFMAIVLTPFYIIYFILSSRWTVDILVNYNLINIIIHSHLVSVGMRKPLTLITW